MRPILIALFRYIKRFMVNKSNVHLLRKNIHTKMFNHIWELSYARIVNLVFRALIMGSKLILMFSLAKYFDAEMLGEFSLISSSVSYSMTLVGIDSWVHNQRLLLATDRSNWGNTLLNHVVGVIFIYICLLPVFYLFFHYKYLDYQYLYLFLLLVFFEAMSQDISRFFVTIHKVKDATVVQFIRMGLWILIIIPFCFAIPNFRHLNVIFISWLLGVLISVAYGIKRISELDIIFSPFKIDYHQIFTALKIGLYYSIGATCFRLAFVADRYCIEYFGDLASVGIYSFYMSIAMSLIAISESGIFSFIYPKIVHSYIQGDIIEFKRRMHELRQSTILLCLFFVISLYLILPYLLSWINNDAYTQNQNILWLLLISASFYAISMIPHYELLAKSKNNYIIIAHVLFLLVFMILTSTLSQFMGFIGVPLSLALSFIALLIIKIYFVHKINDNVYVSTK
jgi:O-antigen/teichoic acid export membrane protein